MKSLPIVSEGIVYDLPFATSYKDAADNLLNAIDLSVQKDSYRQFVDVIIPYYLFGKGYSSKYNTNKTTDLATGLNVVIEFDSWYVKDSPHTPQWCKKHHCSMEAELYANARVQVRNLTERGESVAPHERYIKVLITKFPMLTKSGSMIINGVEKILTSHLEPACKVRLETVEKKGAKGEKTLKFITASRLFNVTKAGVATASNSQVIIQRGKMYGSSHPTYTITIGQYTNVYPLIDFLRAICPNTLKESFLRDILGVSQQLLASLDNNSMNVTKYRTEMDVLENFEVRYTERKNLNRRLSYEKRAAGRTLARDIPELGLKKGHVLTKEDAVEAQFRNLPVYVFPRTGLGLDLRVFSNNFVSADTLFKYYEEKGQHILKTDIFKEHMIHLPTFNSLLEKSKAESTDINTLLKLNASELLGKNLLVDDILALVNLYGAFLANDEDEDDIDSLSVKSLTNISEIYEEIFSSKFRIGGDGYLPERFVNSLNRAKNRGNSDTESYYAISDIDINCEERQTITAKLGTCSLLDQADTAGPLSEVNHLRKISSKKVPGRGGTDSETSMRKPRSVNPSMVNRFDLVESPEGANIGLIRYLTATAMVNAGGEVEAPWLLVNSKSLRIIYDKVFYLDYDREMDLVRAVGASIGDRDAVTIKIYGINPKFRDQTFGLGPVDINKLPWDDDSKWEVIDTQEYPVVYKEEIVEEVLESNELYVTSRHQKGKLRQEDLGCNYKGSYELEDNIDYVKLAESAMKQYGGYKYELDFQRENWFNRQHRVVYKYNRRVGKYEGTVHKDSINCYKGHGQIISVPAEEVDVVSLSDEHIFSPVGASVPFTAYDDLTRKMMSNAHQKSAEPVLYGNKPSISTNIAKKSTDMATGVVKSPVAGTVVFVDSSEVRILEDGTNVVHTVPLVTGFKSVTKTMIISVPSVKLGEKVKKNSLLADSNMTKGGDVAHGIEILGAYMPFEGHNFEDGILLSDRLVARALLTSPHFKTCMQKLTGKRVKTRKSDSEVFSPIQTYKATAEKIEQMQRGRNVKTSKIVRDRHRFNNDYLIKPGLVVSTGDVLAYYISETVSSDSDMKDVKGAGLNTKVKLNSLVYKESETGFIISSDIIQIRGEDYIQIIVGHEEHIKNGDKASGRHGNKGVVTKILPARDMPRLADGRIVDMVWSPLGVPSRMNIGQLHEGQLNVHLNELGLEATMSATERFDIKEFDGLLKELNQDRFGQLTIMNEEDDVEDQVRCEFGSISHWRRWLSDGVYRLYPYMGNVDVYSILVDSQEVLDLRKIIELSNNYKLNQDTYINTNIGLKCVGRREFRVIYDPKMLVNANYALQFGQQGNNENFYIELWLEDGADVDIKFSVSKCDTDKVQLYDGRTGKPYELKTNVVMPFIIKHKHQVSEKIAARSSGTYYNNYDQPPQGKDRDGGQKLGAMEIWGLAESGAVNTYNEYMTYKADDGHGRQRFAQYQTELKFQNHHKSGMQNHRGSITDLELESALGPDTLNAPFITKKITAMLAAAFIDMKYYNEEGDELYIFEDAVKGVSGDNTNVDIVGVRHKDKFIEANRIKTLEAHDDIIKSQRDAAYLSNKMGFKTTDNEYLSGCTLPGVNGYSAEYIVMGSAVGNTVDESGFGGEETPAVADSSVNLGAYDSYGYDDDMEIDDYEFDGEETEDVTSMFNAGGRVSTTTPTSFLGGRIQNDAEAGLEQNQINVNEYLPEDVSYGEDEEIVATDEETDIDIELEDMD